MSARKCIPPFSRPGFLLFEILIVLAVFTTAVFCVMPFFGNRQREQRLEVASEEVASALRQVESAARNESSLYPGESRGLVFYCTFTPEGRAVYGTRKGRYETSPRGVLPEDIVFAAGTSSVRFRKSGPARDSEYRIEMKTRDEKYKRIITVAAYTGRVRVGKK